MGILDSSTLTVNAILTTRGRELLSREGNININKFALSDEEIDYTLHDRKHANGTYAFGRILDNATLLEASPNRSKLSSYLQNEVSEGTDIYISPLNYPRAHWTAVHDTIPTTVGTAEEEAEDYTFTVQNTDVVKFWRFYVHTTGAWHVVSSNTKSVVGRGIQWLPQSINPKATTTITVQGNVSGITKVVSITPVPNPDVNIYPKNTTVDVTDPKFY
jgi:hypothetical protein